MYFIFCNWCTTHTQRTFSMYLISMSLVSGVDSVDISARFCYFIPAPHPTTPPGQFQHTAITTRADISTWTFIFNFQSTVFFRLPVTWMWCLEIIFVLTYIVKSLKVSNEDIEVLVHSSLNVVYKNILIDTCPFSIAHLQETRGCFGECLFLPRGTPCLSFQSTMSTVLTIFQESSH